MRTKGALCNLMIAIFCFSQIVEVNANLRRARAQESIFITMGIQRENIFVQWTNKAFITISGQSSRENAKSISGQQVEKIIFTAIARILEKFALKTVIFLKRWLGSRVSQAFENWKDSLYH